MTLFAKIKAKERAWRHRIGKDISTPEGRRAARLHNALVDHSFIRRVIPNRYKLSDEMWRSNQPDTVHFPKLARLGIKSIINLRGQTPYSYYLFEKEACTDYGIALYDLQLFAQELLPREKYLELFDLFDKVEKPALIHCKSGADRTGLAAAFYMIDYMGAPVAEAARQLSIKYAHQHWTGAGILDHVLAAYGAHIENDPMPVRDWVRDHYDPAALTASFKATRNGPRNAPLKPEHPMSESTRDSMIRWIWREYLRKYRLPLICAILLMAVEGMALGGLSYMIKPMFDTAFSGGTQGAIFLVAGLVAGIFILRAISAFGHKVLMVYVGQQVAAGLQADMVSHMLTLDSNYFRDNSPGTLMERVRGDALAIATIWEMVLSAVARDAVSLVALLGVALWIDWLWVAIAIAAAPVLVLPMSILQKRVRATTTASRDAAAKISTRLDEIFHGINQIKLTGTEQRERSRVDGVIDLFARTHLKSQTNQSGIVAMVDIIAAAGFFGVLFYGGLQIVSGDKTVGEFMSFFTAMALVFDPMRNLGKVSGGWQAALASLERIRNVFDTHATILSPAAPKLLSGPAETADITLDNVQFSYGDTPVLKGTSFTAKAGQTTALVGASGAGKSTVFNLLTRLADADDGAITVGETRVTDLPLDQLRSLFSVVSQEALLFDETLRDNILMGREKLEEGKLEHALDAAHVADFLPRMEQGLETAAGPRGSNLSGGQRQRVAIARAIVRDAPVLLLDEATSALDAKSEKLVQEALDELSQDRTTLVIAHRLSTIQSADKIVVMDQGQVVDQGTHDELLARGGYTPSCMRFSSKTPAPLQKRQPPTKYAPPISRKNRANSV